MEQAIIKIDDIIDGSTLVKRVELDQYALKGEQPVDPTPTDNTTLYNLILLKQNVVWDNGFIKIPHTSSLNINKEVVDVTLRINSVTGTKTLNAVINYPSAETYNAIPYQGFLLKDSEDLLSETNDWDTAELHYNIIDSVGVRYDGIKQILKDGFISDHMNNPADAWHSYATAHTWWDAIFPEYKGNRIQSEQDLLLPYGTIEAPFTANYCALKGADLILRPYTGAYNSENPGSNANILTVGAHSGNLHVREDHNFISPTQFPDNLILVSACNPGDTLLAAPESWPTSFGYGVEFYEELTAQSPTTATVGAKLKKIQVYTGANWGIVRKAARITASNAATWNMYMGFGIINVDAAIQYINDNYKSDSYRAMLADDLEGNYGVSNFLEYADLLPNSPVAKRMLEDIYESVAISDYPMVNPIRLIGLENPTGYITAYIRTDLPIKIINNNQIITGTNVNTDLTSNEFLISLCKKETTLDIAQNHFYGTLNLLKFKDLLHLTVRDNNFSEILVYNSNKLQDIDISNNQISIFEVISFPYLETLNLAFNNNLATIKIQNNSIRFLDITACINLTQLFCQNNLINTLNLSGFSILTHVWCNNNELTSIDITNCNSLRELYISYNQLVFLTKPNQIIQYLVIDHNRLTNQDLSGLNNLIVVELSDNILTSINLSGCSSLTKASCQNNQLDRTAILDIISQVTISAPININTTYPNRLEFAGNPGAASIIPSDYASLTNKGWIVTI